MPKKQRHPKPHPAVHKHSVKWQLITGIAFVLGGLGCTAFLEHNNLLAWPQRALLDSMPATLTTSPSDKVVIVTIDDQDYDQLFGSTSPLKQETVLEVIHDLQDFHPRVIGVDLVTNRWKPELVKVTQDRIVWARLFTPDPSGPLRIAELDKVLGTDGSNVCYGLTAMQADSDLRVRQYPAEYRQVTGSQVVAFPSFPMVVHELMSDRGCPKEGKPQTEDARTEANWDENRLLISYRGPGHEIRKVTVGALIDTHKLKVPEPGPQPPPVIQMQNLLGNRIVLLGGTYKDGRDFYATPVGMIAGVEILGQAILTANSGAVKEAGSRLTWFDLSVGLSLVLLGLRWPKLAAGINVALLLLLIPISGLLYRSFSLFLDAIPVQIGVLLHSTMHPALEGQLERMEKRMTGK
jgi:CHASE2 domain-containing sensor protein